MKTEVSRPRLKSGLEYPLNVLAEVLNSEDNVRSVSIEEFLEDIGNLKGKRKEILELHYNERKTYKEIGEHLGISKSRVAQISRDAVRRLRNHGRAIQYLNR